MNAYAVSSGLLKSGMEALSGEDVREGMTAVVSVRLQNPQFEGQTKTKLGNSEVKGIVEAMVNDTLGAFFKACMLLNRATACDRSPQMTKRATVFNVLSAGSPMVRTV